MTTNEQIMVLAYQGRIKSKHVLTTGTRRLLAYIADAKEVTANEITEYCKCTIGTARSRLNTLVTRGYLNRCQRGTNKTGGVKDIYMLTENLKRSMTND